MAISPRKQALEEFQKSARTLKPACISPLSFLGNVVSMFSDLNLTPTSNQHHLTWKHTKELQEVCKIKLKDGKIRVQKMLKSTVFYT